MLPKTEILLPKLGPNLCWKLNYDPYTKIGKMIDCIIQLPEPDWPGTLYKLASGHVDDFFGVDFDYNQLNLTFTALFEKLTRKQREVVLANLINVWEMYIGLPATEEILHNIRSSCSARLHALMQMEIHPGDFGQDDSIE